jgi:uncharacterized coiled-coil protein SlyX
MRVARQADILRLRDNEDKTKMQKRLDALERSVADITKTVEALKKEVGSIKVPSAKLITKQVNVNAALKQASKTVKTTTKK